MKREEKNQMMRRRIMDSALAEFAGQGYGGSSVNSICTNQGISKGIIYHYFRSKDDLYLACVEECFQLLTQHISLCLADEHGSAEDQLEKYFVVRMNFFRENPVYQPIFCEASISPPDHLNNEIQERKRDFDKLNVGILEKLLQNLPLQPDITKEEVVDTFRQYQDFINAKFKTAGIRSQEFEKHEESCRKALNILLYGIIKREG
ncbi:MAG: TetR/AcrR family transcriptional regulator [Anaerovoracaceae bacterium]